MTGKLLWTFHTSAAAPENWNHNVWQEDQWQGRSGLNAWGIITVDTKNGIVFLPVGTPTTDFYGADRHGSNLYGSSVVALDAATGKLKWYFQTVHHDNWDYDDTAAPVMITVKQHGKEVPAVAQITKEGYLFILNRFTGKPIYDVVEKPVALDNIPPGDDPSPTQPVPVKPPPLTRVSFAPDELAKLTPEHDKACADLLKLEGGVMTGGPFAEYGPKLRVIFPGWTGGSNWWGMSYDPTLGYLFINTKADGMLNKLVKKENPGEFGMDYTYDRVGPDNPPPGGGGSFQIGQWPCEAPPWGEFIAVNVNTGDIAWRVPFGSFPELDAMGIPPTGRGSAGWFLSDCRRRSVHRRQRRSHVPRLRLEDRKGSLADGAQLAGILRSDHLPGERRQGICCRNVQRRRQTGIACTALRVRAVACDQLPGSPEIPMLRRTNLCEVRSGPDSLSLDMVLQT